MNKLLLTAMLATCTMTSAHAAPDYFRLYCNTKYDSKGPIDVADTKIVGTNKIAYVRRVETYYPNSEAMTFTYDGQMLNEVGESRYYVQDTGSGSMILSEDNSTVTFTQW